MTCPKPVKILMAAFLLCAAAAFSSFAATVYTEDAFYYTIEDRSITITGYFGEDEVVNVPSMIAGLPVNHIAPYAFEGTGVAVVNLPETIETVEKDAFDANTQVNYFQRENNDPGPGLGDNSGGENGTISEPETPSEGESGDGGSQSGSLNDSSSGGSYGRIVASGVINAAGPGSNVEESSDAALSGHQEAEIDVDELESADGTADDGRSVEETGAAVDPSKDGETAAEVSAETDAAGTDGPEAGQTDAGDDSENSSQGTSTENAGGVSTGAAAGILGAVVAVLAVFFLIFFGKRRKKKDEEQ